MNIGAIFSQEPPMCRCGSRKVLRVVCCSEWLLFLTFLLSKDCKKSTLLGLPSKVKNWRIVRVFPHSVSFQLLMATLRWLNLGRMWGGNSLPAQNQVICSVRYWFECWLWWTVVSGWLPVGWWDPNNKRKKAHISSGSVQHHIYYTTSQGSLFFVILVYPYR